MVSHSLQQQANIASHSTSWCWFTLLIPLLTLPPQISTAATTTKSRFADCGSARLYDYNEQNDTRKGRISDYRDQTKEGKFHLFMVEKAHYFGYLEILHKASHSKGEIHDMLTNFDFVLNAIPNHTGALYAISKLQRLMGGKLPQNAFANSTNSTRSVDCYAHRAIKHAPNDPGVYLVYAIHLHQEKDFQGALEFYKKSERLNPDATELNYNLGLLYFDLKKYELARKYAKKAYELGYKLPGLKRKLVRIKQW